MSLGCFTCRSALATIHAGHATDAVRLEVESHLNECEGCREEQGRWTVIGELKTAPTQRLSSEARDRVRRAMMQAALAGKAGEAHPSAHGWRLALAGAAVAAAALVTFIGVSGGHGHPGAEVVSGQIAVGGITAEPGTEISDGQELATHSGGSGVVRLDGPVVELAGETRVAWRRGARAIDLKRGQVIVEVEPDRGLQFRVATSRFAAEVVGTRFVVTESSVMTMHGKVRVVDIAGKELAMVGAGERWTWSEPVTPPAAGPAVPVVTVSAPVAASPTAPIIAVEGPAPAAAAELVRPAEEKATARVMQVRARSGRGAVDAPANDDPEVLLDRANKAQADGNNGEMRAILSELLLRHPPAHIDAEAGMMLADGARNEGARDEAIRRYRDVINRHGSLPAAESALFSIGLLESQMGRVDDARRTLGDYLARYPHGNYTSEARSRLSHLDPQ